MTERLPEVGGGIDEFVAQGRSVVDFWASWCGPCRALDPVLESLAGEVPEVRWGKVEITRHPDVAARFAVRTVPTIVVFADGVPVKTMIGARSRQQILRALAVKGECSDDS